MISLAKWALLRTRAWFLNGTTAHNNAQIDQTNKNPSVTSFHCLVQFGIPNPWVGECRRPKNSRPRKVWPSNMVAAKKCHCPTEGRDSLSPAPAASCPQNPVMGKTLCPKCHYTAKWNCTRYCCNPPQQSGKHHPNHRSHNPLPHKKKHTKNKQKQQLLRWSASSQRTNTHTTGWNTKRHKMGWLSQSNSHDSSHMSQCCYSLSRSISLGGVICKRLCPSYSSSTPIIKHHHLLLVQPQFLFS